MEIKLVWKGRLPGLNDMIAAMNRNRFKGNELKQETQRDLRWEFLLQANGRKTAGKSLVTVHFFEPNARRDEDNVIAGCKYILDTLKGAEIIPDDSPKYVHLLPEVFIDRKDPRIEIEIKELDDGEGKIEN